MFAFGTASLMFTSAQRLMSPIKRCPSAIYDRLISLCHIHVDKLNSFLLEKTASGRFICELFIYTIEDIPIKLIINCSDNLQSWCVFASPCFLESSSVTFCSSAIKKPGDIFQVYRSIDIRVLDSCGWAVLKRTLSVSWALILNHWTKDYFESIFIINQTVLDGLPSNIVLW